MTRSSLLLLGCAPLGDPLCDIAFAPHAALRGVVGQIETSANGNVVLRVGRRLHPQSSSDYTWRQTEHVVLTPGVAEAMAYEMLEAIGFNTDEGLPRRRDVDALQRRADEIYAADRAEDVNLGRDDA